MRYTEFWRRMEAVLGPQYAASWAADHHIEELGDRTVLVALEQGDSVQVVWRAVVRTIDVPPALR
ncbi:DUF3046 domain-containing protein [Candidatus Nanopelagicales bacterium]|nr:DUF3046 domain-containing protein [Candidatus Nanopelagicales bacterium]